MAPTYTRRKAPSLALVLLVALALTLSITGLAFGEGTPQKEVPGYPKFGCYDIAVGGTGMWGGSSPYPMSVDVPGPVVDAYLVWVGTEDVGAPNSPNQSDLVADGTPIVGALVDQYKPGTGDPWWYMWRADVGPNGQNLVKQGLNKYNISGWNLLPDPSSRRNGISLVVVYSTGACERPNQINLIDNFDYYWERLTGTTDVLAFTFPPAPVDRDITVWLHHAGSDHTKTQPAEVAAVPSAVAPNSCREMNLWAKVGPGAPPTNLVNYYATPPQPANGGKLVATDPFVGANCGSTTWTFPVTGLLGWVDGFGWTRDVGGYIAPEWSIVRVTLRVRAGDTYAALQLESEKTGSTDVELTGESGAWFAQAVIPLYNPELKISKTDGVDQAKPGDTLTYTINYENYGASPAENVTIVDKLPEWASYAGASNGGVYDAATDTVKWNIGTLAMGQKGSVTLTLKLDPVFPAGSTILTNTATIAMTTAGDTDTADNTATDTTTVTAKAELSIDKSAAPEPVAAGANLTYTIKWTVGGDAFSEAVKITDTLPADVSFVSATDAGLYDATTRTVTWLLGDVTPVMSGEVQVVVKVKSPLYNNTKIENTAVIANKAGDRAEDSVISTVTASHVLKVEKVGAPEPVDAGTDLTYTINWGVTGNEPADNAKLVDTLPAKVVFKSASDGGVFDLATRTITWELGDLVTPENGTVTVVVSVLAPEYNGTKLKNMVDFSDTTPGSTAVQIIQESTVRSNHEFILDKVDDPDPVAKGGQITYTIDWNIVGNEPADDVVLKDPVPFGTQFVSAANGGVYDQATNTVVWTIGDKLPGDSGAVTFVVKVNKDFPNNLQIVNTAIMSDFRPDAEKQVEELTDVIQTPEGLIGDTVWLDLNANGVEEPGEPGLAGVGLLLSGAGADGNCGTADDVALANTVTDANGKYAFAGLEAGVYCVDVVNATVPAGLALVSGTDPAQVTLAEGQENRAVDFGYKSQNAGVIGDRVWSDANGNGVQDAGEVGIGGVTVQLVNAGADKVCGTADDAVAANTTTSASGSYLFAGVLPGVYCVKVTDTGAVLTGLTLTGGKSPTDPITLAAGQTYLDADFGYQGLTGQIGDLVFYDANRNGIYEVGPNESGVAGVTINLVAAGADGVFGSGDDVTLATTTTGANGAYLFSGVPNGTYHVVVTDLNGRLVGYTQTYGLPNTNNHGQVSPYPVTISGGNAVLTADFGFADGHLLSITKINNVSPNRAEAGAQLIYTIGYTVSGREAAPNVVITDVLPQQLDFVSASNGGTYDAATRTVKWMLGTLEPGTSGSVTLTVLVKRGLENNSFIFNTAVITDDAKVTDDATNIVRVRSEPKLELTKTASPAGNVEPGTTITYQICYKNTGNANATGVVLTDPIPANTAYVPGSASAGAVYSEVNKTLTWTLGTVAYDAQACVSFKAMVNNPITGPSGNAAQVVSFAEWNVQAIVNTATLTSNELSPVTATVSNPLVAVQIYKSISRPILHTGEELSFTLTVENNGGANATNVVVTDQISPRLEQVTVTSTKGVAVFDPATRMLTVNIGTMAPNDVVKITIKGLTVRVPPEQLPYNVVNVGQVNFSEGAPRLSNEVVAQVVYFMPGEIPEPGTWLLLGSGLAGLAGYAQMRGRARRRKNG